MGDHEYTRMPLMALMAIVALIPPCHAGLSADRDAVNRGQEPSKGNALPPVTTSFSQALTPFFPPPRKGTRLA